MKTSSILSVVLLSCAVGFNHVIGQTDEQLQLIDELIERYMNQSKVLGYGLSVVQNGKIIISKGYGKANIAQDIDVQNNTLFAVGSISKTLTSLLAVKVLSENFPQLGETVFDTPIVKLAPSLNFTLSDRYRTESTTFRDLLAHRTCLSSGDMIIFFQAATYDEVTYRQRYDREICSFRTAFSYNNGMIQLAGSLLGQIAGKTYPELMAELFSEIGMVHSRVLDAEGIYEDLPNMSRAYTRIENEVVQFDPAHLRKASIVGGGGGVLTTPNDMAHFLLFMFNGGAVGGKQVIPTEVLNWMYTVSAAIDFDASTGTGGYGYGLGLSMAMLKGAPWIKHNGFFAPYETNMNMFPLENNSHIGVFGSHNGPGGTTGIGPDILTQDGVHVLIKEILEGKVSSSQQVNEFSKGLGAHKIFSTPSIDFESHPLSPQNVQKSLKPIQRTGKVATRQLRVEELVGNYGNSENGDLSITYVEANETLRLNYGKWGVGNLITRANDINIYDVEWTTTVYYDMYAFGLGNGIFPKPKSSVDFGVPHVMELIIFEILGQRYSFKFNKGETLDTLPEIPWSPESCGPEYNLF